MISVYRVALTTVTVTVKSSCLSNIKRKSYLSETAEGEVKVRWLIVESQD